MKTDANLAAMSCRDFADYMKQTYPDWGCFEPKGVTKVIYLNTQSRLLVTREQHTEPGFGHNRLEAKAEVASHVDDTDEFVNDFVEVISEFLSLHQLKRLIPALEALRDEEEAARRQRVVAAQEAARQSSISS